MESNQIKQAIMQVQTMTTNVDTVIEVITGMTTEFRDARLHDLYERRDLLEFMYGQKWFNERVTEIHHEYWRCYTSDPNYRTRLAIEEYCWAEQHGYRP